MPQAILWQGHENKIFLDTQQQWISRGSLWVGRGPGPKNQCQRGLQLNFATLYDYITKDLGASLYRDNIQVTIMAIWHWSWNGHKVHPPPKKKPNYKQSIIITKTSGISEFYFFTSKLEVYRQRRKERNDKLCQKAHLSLGK